MTALHWAADMGHLEVVELLIKEKADLKAVDSNGLTALLWAAARGQVDCAKALIAAKIDVNATDNVRKCLMYYSLTLIWLTLC